MKIEIDAKLVDAVPDFKIGINHYTKTVVSESPQMFKGRFQLFQEQLFFELEDKKVTDLPGIKEWRTVWKSLGADPNRYRHSTEALLRRIGKQNYIKPFHSAVDLNNFFSLQYQIPVGIYDYEKMNGNVSISLGNEEDGYDGLNGRYNSLQNIILLKDDQGPFGSPFVDSIQTSVTEATTEALHIFFIRPSIDVDEAYKLTNTCGKMFTDISGGDFKSFVLHKGQTAVNSIEN